jgi:hypothetical protein
VALFPPARSTEQIAFATGLAGDARLGFDNVRIRGTLQKAWLEERLNKLRSGP